MEGFIAIIVLLLIASIIHVLSKKFKLPYTIMLFLMGILLIPLEQIPGLSVIQNISLTPDILFYIFLPILIFESGYNIRYQDISRDHIIIWLLATVGICMSVGVIATLSQRGLSLIGIDIPWIVLALLGIIISATDPVAVLSLFKDMGVPHRLSLLFEGESLFNDGTAVALFSIALGIITHMGEESIDIAHHLGLGAMQFVVMVAGGIGIGLLWSRIFAKALQHIHNNEVVEITLTMLLAHITFISTDIINHYLHHFGHREVSGVIATAYAAIIMGNYGKTKISPSVEKYMDKFWSFFSFLANSLIFILMGVLVGSTNIPLQEMILPAIIVIASVIVARAISIYIPLHIVNTLHIQKHIPLARQHLMARGSLRGALAITLVLMIPDDLTIPGWTLNYSVKHLILILIIACVVFSLVIKGLTMKPLIKRLGIDKLHNIEIFEQHETNLTIHHHIAQKIKNLNEDYELAPQEYENIRHLHRQAYETERQAFQSFLDSFTPSEREKLIHQSLLLHSLGIEKQYLTELFEYNEVSEAIYIYLKIKIERQIMRVEEGEPQFRTDKKCHTSSRYERGILHRCINQFYYKKHDQHDHYLINRTKYILTQKVIKELETFKAIKFNYGDEAVDQVIAIYNKLHYDAQQKLIGLQSQCSDIIMSTNHTLLHKGIIKEKLSIIQYMYDHDIITHKLYDQFLEEADLELSAAI